MAGDHTRCRLSVPSRLGRSSELRRINVARAVGPALGGIVVAAAGAGWSFLLNAASFFGVILFLYSWKQTPRDPRPHCTVRSSIVEGLRYVRGAPQVRSVLIRTGAFSLGAASLLALLPVICQ